MELDKTKLKDSKGRYLVQGLFLEDRYDADMSVFTFDGEDKLYKGKTYISLRKRFIEMGDPTEYAFAKEWLSDYNQWKRLCANKVVGRHIEEWRDELRLSLMSDGVLSLIDLAVDGKHYQAAKWLADAGFDTKQRGRPSKDELEGEIKRRVDEREEWAEGAQLLKFHKDKK